MKKKFSYFLVAFIIGVSSLLAMTDTSAYWCRNGYCHSNRYYQSGNNGYYYGQARYHCKMVGGYWHHGYWYPARKVCWY